MDTRQYILSRAAQNTAGPADLKALLRQKLLGIAPPPAAAAPVEEAPPIMAPEIDDVPAPPMTSREQAASIMQDAASAAATTPHVDELPGATPATHSAKVEDKTQAGRKTQQSLNLMLNPEDVAAAVEQAKSMPEYQGQAEGIDQLNQMLRASVETTHPQLDLTPAMSLVDQWTGSKLASNYKAPTTADESKTRILNAASKIQDDKRDLFKSLLSSISAQKGGGTLMDALTMMRLQGASDSIAPPKPDHPKDTTRAKASDYKSAVNMVQQDPEYRELTKSASALDRAVTLLNQKSAAGDKVAISNIIRGVMMDSRITNYDQQNAKANLGGLGNRFDQIWQDMVDGKLSPANRGDYLRVLSAVRQSQMQRLNLMNDRFRSLLEGLPNMTPQLIDRVLNGKLASARALSKPTHAAPIQINKPVDQMSQAELDAYEAQLKARVKH